MGFNQGLSVRKCGAKCIFDRVPLEKMMIAHLPSPLPWVSGTSFPSIFLGVVSLSNHAPRDPRSDPAEACTALLGERSSGRGQ